MDFLLMTSPLHGRGEKELTCFVDFRDLGGISVEDPTAEDPMAEDPTRRTKEKKSGKGSPCVPTYQGVHVIKKMASARSR